MRQWDTKKQFKPRYKFIAELVFLGIFRVFRESRLRVGLGLLGEGLKVIAFDFGSLLLAIGVLALCPITFPLFCLMEKLAARRARLNYLRRNRAMDEDI